MWRQQYRTHIPAKRCAVAGAHLHNRGDRSPVVNTRGDSRRDNRLVYSVYFAHAVLLQNILCFRRTARHNFWQNLWPLHAWSLAFRKYDATDTDYRRHRPYRKTGAGVQLGKLEFSRARRDDDGTLQQRSSNLDERAKRCRPQWSSSNPPSTRRFSLPYEPA